MDVAYERLTKEMGRTRDLSTSSDDTAVALADVSDNDGAPNMSAWSAHDQAAYIAKHPDLFDLAAKRGDTEAEQEAYEDLP